MTQILSLTMSRCFAPSPSGGVSQPVPTGTAFATLLAAPTVGSAATGTDTARASVLPVVGSEYAGATAATASQAGPLLAAASSTLYPHIAVERPVLAIKEGDPAVEVELPPVRLAGAPQDLPLTTASHAPLTVKADLRTGHLSSDTVLHEPLPSDTAPLVAEESTAPTDAGLLTAVATPEQRDAVETGHPAAFPELPFAASVEGAADQDFADISSRASPRPDDAAPAEAVGTDLGRPDPVSTEPARDEPAAAVILPLVAAAPSAGILVPNIPGAPRSDSRRLEMAPSTRTNESLSPRDSAATESILAAEPRQVPIDPRSTADANSRQQITAETAPQSAAPISSLAGEIPRTPEEVANGLLPAPVPASAPASSAFSTAPETPIAAAMPEPIAARHGEIGRQLGVEIARHSQDGRDSLIVRLDPVEFGKIQIRIQFDDEGNLRAHVAAESPAALEMLRRDSGDLVRALNDAGVRTDSQSFQFDARGQNRDQNAQRQLPSQNALKDDLPPEAEVRDQPGQRRSNIANSLDLFA